MLGNDPVRIWLSGTVLHNNQAGRIYFALTVLRLGGMKRLEKMRPAKDRSGKMQFAPQKAGHGHR